MIDFTLSIYVCQSSNDKQELVEKIKEQSDCTDIIQTVASSMGTLQSK